MNATTFDSCELARRCYAMEETALRNFLSRLGQDTPMAASPPPRSVAEDGKRRGVIGVLHIYGVILPRGSYGTNLERFRDDLDGMLRSPTIDAVVLKVDSPGGVVDNIEETAAMIYAGRRRKPIAAIADSMAASAAFWLASAAEKLFVVPSGQVGSVGVWIAHMDLTRLNDEMGVRYSLVSSTPEKTERSPLVALSDDARQDMEREVQSYYRDFVRDLAKFRGVSAAFVKANFGSGRLVRASEAVSRGLADAVGQLADAIGAAGKLAGTRAAAKLSAEVRQLEMENLVGGPPELRRIYREADIQTEIGRIQHERRQRELAKIEAENRRLKTVSAIERRDRR